MPVHNEEEDLAPERRAPPRLSQRASRSAGGSRSSTTRARTPRWRSPRRSPSGSPTCAPSTSSEKGRGRALRSVWSASDAQVVAYMDVDLSTDLAALLPLVAPLLSGHSDVAIGSRLAAPRASCAARSARRSRAPTTCCSGPRCGARFSDAQCGFKALRADCARELLPLVEDADWFFDTELLVLAERAGLRIHEVPVDWIDDPDSRVDIVATAVADLRGIARVGRALATRAARRRRTELGRAAGRTPACRRAGAALRRSRRRQHARLRRALRRCCAQALGAQGANLVALLADRGREHRGEPAAHVRRPRPPPAPRAARSRASSCSRRARPDRRRRSPLLAAARPGRRRAPSSSPCSSPRARSRPSSASCSCAPGSSTRAAPAAAPTSTSDCRHASRSVPPRRASVRRGCARGCAAAPRPARWARRARRPARRDRAALPVAPRRSGYANEFYAAAAQAGVDELEGVALRLARPGELDHGRQAAGVAVGDGALGPALRRRALEHPRAAGARGRRRGRRSCTPPCAAASAPPAGLLAGAVLALTPVAALDVPLRQPGRAATSCSGRRRPTPSRGRSSAPAARWLLLAGALVGFAFLTKMLQAFLVVPAFAARLPGRGADAAAARGSCSCSRAAPRCSSRPAGGSRSSSSGRPSRPYIGGSHRQQRARADLRLQRPRPHHRRRDGSVAAAAARRRARAASGARPGSCGCSTTRWAAQISWLLPAALLVLVAGSLWAAPARRAPTAAAPRCCSGAAGWSSPGSSSA